MQCFSILFVYVMIRSKTTNSHQDKIRNALRQLHAIAVTFATEAPNIPIQAAILNLECFRQAIQIPISLIFVHPVINYVKADISFAVGTLKELVLVASALNPSA